MVQVLHLMNCDPDLQSQWDSETIRRAAPADIAITIRHIGRGGYYRTTGRGALALRFGRGTLFDVVHAWDMPSVIAACGSPSPIVFSPSQPPSVAPALLRMAMVYRNGTAIATTAVMKRALIQRGIPAFRCNFIPPAVDLARISSGRDEAMRESLGISREDRVVLAPGESTRAAGHHLALHTMSILQVLDSRYRLLLWGRGGCSEALVRLAGGLRQSRLLVSAERRLGRSIAFEELLMVADMAMVTAAPLAPPLPVLLCMAAGLPIVAVKTSVTDELLENSGTAEIVARSAPRLLAKTILELFENPGQASRLAEAGRAEAARRFDPVQSTARYFSLYRQLSGVAPKGSRTPRELNHRPKSPGGRDTVYSD
jgi:glycosyltransferase involved in cell wall biosynthesis